MTLHLEKPPWMVMHLAGYNARTLQLNSSSSILSSSMPSKPCANKCIESCVQGYIFRKNKQSMLVPMLEWPAASWEVALSELRHVLGRGALLD